MMLRVQEFFEGELNPYLREDIVVNSMRADGNLTIIDYDFCDKNFYMRVTHEEKPRMYEVKVYSDDTGALNTFSFCGIGDTLYEKTTDIIEKFARIVSFCENF